MSTIATQGAITATGGTAVIAASVKKPLNISIGGTFVGTVQIERSFDNGTTWYPVAQSVAGTIAAYTAPVSLSLQETEDSVQYRLNCTAYTSGTINFRLSM